MIITKENTPACAWGIFFGGPSQGKLELHIQGFSGFMRTFGGVGYRMFN
jgi:hypothetical protein